MSAEVGTKEHPMEVQRVGYDGNLGVWGERCIVRCVEGGEGPVETNRPSSAEAGIINF